MIEDGSFVLSVRIGELKSLAFKDNCNRYRWRGENGKDRMGISQTVTDYLSTGMSRIAFIEGGVLL